MCVVQIATIPVGITVENEQWPARIALAVHPITFAAYSITLPAHFHEPSAYANPLPATPLHPPATRNDLPSNPFYPSGQRNLAMGFAASAASPFYSFTKR